MTQFADRRTFRLTLISSALALALSACGGAGTTRIASIGDAPGGTADAGGGSGGDGSGNGAGSGSGGSGSGGNGSGGSGGGAGGGGTNAAPLGGPLLVTAGNAVIGLGDKHAGLAGTVNGKLPATGPVTGTVTAVLRKTGQTLVDLGNGRSAVLNRAGGAVGRLVTIDLGSGRVIGAPGATGLIGASALTPTQLAGVTVATPRGSTGGTTGGVLGRVGTVATGVTGAVPVGTTNTPQPATGLPVVGSVVSGVKGKLGKK